MDGAPAAAPDPSSLPGHGNRDTLRELLRGDHFAVSVGAVPEARGPGWARFAGTLIDEHPDVARSVHGGAVFALGDDACAVTCTSWGRAPAAPSVDVHHLSAVGAGDQPVAVGVERGRTRRTGNHQIDVRGPDQRVGSLHAMADRTGARHLGEDAWPDEWRAGA